MGETRRCNILLTLSSIFILEKLIFAQLANQNFYGTWSFIMLSTTVHYADSNQSSPYPRTIFFNIQIKTTLSSPPNVSSPSAKQPFLSHSLPYKIVPELSFGFHTFGFRNRASLSALRQTINHEGQVPTFILCMSPSVRVAQLYPQAPGSFFIAFYDS
jgi:hypothetical protein